MASEMPMFPLGTVLFPTMVLPLRVFEPRYREMVAHCLASDPEFGVCLIERGREVGGGDQRTSVGTVAQIVEAQQLPNGHARLVTVGTRRIVVDQWLPDDPYPKAFVRDWLDEPFDEDLSQRRDSVVDVLRQALAFQAELGEPGPPATIDIDADPTIAAYQVASLSPIGAFDRQRLLAAPDVPGRFDLLEAMLAEAAEVLHARLTMER